MDAQQERYLCTLTPSGWGETSCPVHTCGTSPEPSEELSESTSLSPSSPRGQEEPGGFKKIKCNCWLSPASGQKAECKEVGDTTAGPWVQLEGPAALPCGPTCQALLQLFPLPGKLGDVMCCTREGSAAFLALTKQCSPHPSSQKSSSLCPTLQISAHAVEF